MRRGRSQPGFGDRGIRPMVAKPLVASRPYATYGLIAVNVVIFAMCVAQARGMQMLNSRLFVDWALIKPWVEGGDYWRLLTAGFLHFSVTHIALNMISLYILGRDLELAVGIPRYLAIYFTSLLGGSAAVMLLGSDNAVNAGASGAIYGLMGAVLVVVLKARASPAPVITIIVINLVMSVTIPGISLLAHVGGLLFGAATTAGIILLPQWVLSPEKRTAAAVGRIGWIAVIVLLIVAVAIGVGVGLADSSPAVVVR